MTRRRSSAPLATEPDKVGKLVCVKGAVIRASSPRVLGRRCLTCPKCKKCFRVSLPDGRYRPPTSAAEGCRGAKHFMPQRSEARTRDFQKVTIQETPEAGQAHEELYGRVPRSIDIELLDELVDSCVPGDHVKIVGMVKSVEVVNEGGGGFGKSASSKPKCMYLLYVEALSVLDANEGGGALGGGRRDGRQQQHAPAAQANEEAAAAGCTQLSQRADANGAHPNAASVTSAAVRANAAGFSVRDLQEISRSHAMEGADVRGARSLDVPHHLQARGRQGRAAARALWRQSAASPPLARPRAAAVGRRREGGGGRRRRRRRAEQTRGHTRACGGRSGDRQVSDADGGREARSSRRVRVQQHDHKTGLTVTVVKPRRVTLRSRRGRS